MALRAGFHGTVGQSSAQVIDGSLKFDDDKYQYLKKTFSSGNGRTWTWSAWVKKYSFGSDHRLFESSADSNNQGGFKFIGDQIQFFFRTSGSFDINLYTEAYFRDTGWYHMMAVVDTTISSPSTDRVKLYVNGVLQTISSSYNTYPSENYQTRVNSNVEHAIGRFTSGDSQYMNGAMSQVYFIDGQALGPEYFGFTDPLTNTWRPKKYTGTFTGTNTFYLPFDGNSPIGQDKSGNGNDWTPVNFGGSVALDNPIVSGALPILNTDGGGKVARVGVRTDAYASSLVLALPLVGSTNDVSNRINSGSTTKTTSDTRTHNSFGNFYSGSATFTNNAKNDKVDYSGDLTLGTNDFTLEFWMYRVGDGSNTSFETIVDTRTTDNNTVGFSLGVNSSGSIKTYGIPAGTGSVSHGDGNDIGWNHFALVRGGGEFRIYQNGILVHTSSEGSTNYSQGAFRLGAANASVGSGDWNYNGYLQDLRLYIGVTKYTSNFIPASTSPDILPDTPSGVSGSSKLAKITDGAVAFDGTGDFLQVPASTDLNIGSSDFTAEAWIYPTQYGEIIGAFNLSIPYNGWLLGTNFDSSGGKLVVWLRGSSNTDEIYKGNTVVPLNRWSHIAFTKSGTSHRFFLNGVLDGTHTTSNETTASGQAVNIGADANSLSAPGRNFGGFISNLRIIKGTALYTSNFTPPTAPLTDVTNTKLLCCQSNTSAGSAVVSPNITGAGTTNSGVVWSDNTTGTIFANRPKENLFDGDTSTSMAPGTSAVAGITTVTLTIPGGLSNVTSVRVYVDANQVNQSPSVTLNSDSAQSISGSAQWVTLTAPSGGTLNTVKFTGNATSTINNLVEFNAFEVNGVILTDPVKRVGDAAATNFNPFNTDINTVRGQETGYATLNPLAKDSSYTLSNGNLSYSGDVVQGLVASTIFASSGKYYCEYQLTTQQGDTGIGVGDERINPTEDWIGEQSYQIGYLSDGRIFKGSSNLGNYGSFGTGDVIGCCFDVDTGRVWFAKNNIWVNSGNPAGGTGEIQTISGGNPLTFTFRSVGSGAGTVNFGQKPFKFSPPDGFQPLNAANVRPSTVIARPDQYVGIATWTGDGNNRFIEYGMQPDLFVVKARNDTYRNGWFDSVRGFKNVIWSDRTLAETNNSTYPEDPTSTGITVNNDDGQTNQNTKTYVGWAWKAGGNKNTFNVDDVGYATASAAGLTAGTITPTGASVGTKQGFSIIKYAGSGTSGDTLPHGLSQTPDFIITKNLTDGAVDWIIKPVGLLTNDSYMLIFNTNAQFQGTGGYISAQSSTTVTFTDGANDGNYNNSGDNYIMYAWHNVPGLQKFGGYTANGLADGNFIELGFRPAILWIKATGSYSPGNWFCHDAARDTFNPTAGSLQLDSSNAEDTLGAAYYVDFLSNGFKLRANGNGENGASGYTYIYAAWAEAPSFNLYGGQSNAR